MMYKNKIILFVCCACALISCLVVLYRTLDQGSRNGSLDGQMITFLQEYIRINTSHPTPAYAQAYAFLKKQAQRDGFGYQDVTLPSGKKAVIISFLGTDKHLPALALNHHMDVVPAGNEHWIVPPFAGAVHEGAVIGRGAQDMKGIAAIHYGALRALKASGLQPRRSIYIFAVPDEEIGGFTGTKEFVQTQTFKDLHVGFVIDEGHASGDEKFIDIKIAERKPIQVRVTTHGQTSHGSHLLCKNPIHELAQFLHDIVTIHVTQQQRVNGQVQAGECLSCNITSLTAGVFKPDGSVTLNMVPDTVQATIDIRVPPTKTCEQIRQMLNKMVKKYPTLTYEVLAQATEEPALSTKPTKLFKEMSTTIKKFNLHPRTHFFEASSDVRFYLIRGIDGIGLTPFTVQDNVHGINESVPIDQLICGRDIMLQFLKDFCL